MELQDLIKKLTPLFTKDLLHPSWKKQVLPADPPLKGHCYVFSEVLFHLWGKQNGFTPCRLKIPTGTHWFLRKGEEIVDPTVSQFLEPPDYTKAVNAAFLTKNPSLRAKTIMEQFNASN